MKYTSFVGLKQQFHSYNEGVMSVEIAAPIVSNNNIMPQTQAERFIEFENFFISWSVINIKGV